MSAIISLFFVGIAAVAIENSEGGKWLKENYKYSHCIPNELQSQIDSQYLESLKTSVVKYFNQENIYNHVKMWNTKGESALESFGETKYLRYYSEVVHFCVWCMDHLRTDLSNLKWIWSITDFVF